MVLDSGWHLEGLPFAQQLPIIPIVGQRNITINVPGSHRMSAVCTTRVGKVAPI